MDRRTLGVIGGGEISRMMTEAAHRAGIRVAILDPQGSSSPAGQIAPLCVQGNLQDYDKLEELAQISDVLTLEGVNVDADALQLLESADHLVHPHSNVVRTVQNRFLQKERMLKCDIPVADAMVCPTKDTVFEAGTRFGYPLVLKPCNAIPDRPGNIIVENISQIEMAFERLGAFEIYAEKWVSIVKELSVIAVRTPTEVFVYPVVETIRQNRKCHRIVIAPAQISQGAQENASLVAKQAVSSFNDIGVYVVNLFLLSDDSVLVNNIIPHPHSSGNYSLEACDIDQFEMHLRAVLGLPCPIPEMKVPFAMTINVVGQETMDSTKLFLHHALTVPNTRVHWYGKHECQLDKNMAHVTITGKTIEELRQRAELLGISKETHGLPLPGAKVGILIDSDANLPLMEQAVKILEQFEIPFELKIISAHRTPTSMYAYAQTAAERGIQVIIASASGTVSLPAMLASLTSLPIIAVPLQSSMGCNTVLSIVQNVPVATVGVDCALNAGLLAIRILAVQDEKLFKKMDEFMLQQEEEVIQQGNELETLGYKDYLAKYRNYSC